MQSTLHQRAVRIEANNILDDHCKECEKRIEFNTDINRNKDEEFITYCNSVCPIGTKLQTLGNQLGSE